MIRIGESAPPATLTLTPTIPITCPPCSVTFHIVSYVGLKLSKCSVTFSATDPVMANQTITVEAIKTPGSFSRVARIVWAVSQPQHPGTCWDNYTPSHTPV